jgi:hypothetical protein
MYPEKIDKLIIGGTTPRVRSSFKHLLWATIDLMEKGDMNTFSEGVVMNLVNFSKKETTKIPRRVISGFYKNMKVLNENDRLRYKHNTERLLRPKDINIAPKCPTLVFTGEYDNFTSPYENFLIAKKCENHIFCLIKDADHLAQLERRSVLIELYKAFLAGEDVESLEGVKSYEENGFAGACRRLDERPSPKNGQATLVNAEGNREVPCKVVDINYHGCCVELDEENIDILSQGEHFGLSMKEATDLKLSVFPVVKGNMLHCVFRKGDFLEGEKLQDYVASLA